MPVLKWLSRLLRGGRPPRIISAAPEDLERAERVLGEFIDDDRVSRLEARLERVRREVERLRERVRGGSQGV
ncbi:hypothetical protein HRbin02_01509 [Candidatus Calditenuaceae archaeon HR02]|nr:hypothetical protein HRbin02_01509 [Candidatus Calditenuaceae archaeon HR02]